MVGIRLVRSTLVVSSLLVGIVGCDDGGGGSATFGVTLVLKDASGQPASSFASGQTITLELSVTNLTNLPQTISFPTSQQYDFLVLNHRKNAIVWTSGSRNRFRRVGGGDFM